MPRGMILSGKQLPIFGSAPSPLITLSPAFSPSGAKIYIFTPSSYCTKAIRDAEEELNGTGRVVVRYSGTEALARVMIEAESEEKMTRFAESIAGAIQQHLGL